MVATPTRAPMNLARTLLMAGIGLAFWLLEYRWIAIVAWVVLVGLILFYGLRHPEGDAGEAGKST